ncbi:MAG: S24 family peptidase [Chloroflexota bacterium]|nr:S24 family peptidase [Chloroflexota bacterium]
MILMYFRDQNNFFSVAVSAGFPSPAGDLFASQLNLQDYLVKNPNSTIYVKVSGDSMSGVGIFSGDTLIVDKSSNPKNNSIVLCILDGDFLVKKLNISTNSTNLISANKKYEPIVVTEYNDFRILGVVVASIKKFI